MKSIDVLVASMNNNFEKNEALFLRSDKVKYIVINQVTEEIERTTELWNRDDIGIYNYQERGLSKSRNRAIEHSKAEICIIADDDIFFDPQIFDTLRREYSRNEKIAVVTYQDRFAELKRSKVYKNKRFKHNFRSVMGVTSFEISFRRESIVESKIKFDERFGLGSYYGAGEENIFLLDILRSNYILQHCCEFLVNHDDESTGNQYNKNSAITRGAVFARMFGLKAYLIDIYVSLKKYRIYRTRLGFFSFLFHMFKGSTMFISSKKPDNNYEAKQC